MESVHRMEVYDRIIDRFGRGRVAAPSCPRPTGPARPRHAARAHSRRFNNHGVRTPWPLLRPGGQALLGRRQPVSCRRPSLVIRGR
ncbi:hypothetical protein ACWGH7_34330 [Streptomyces cyaneofuscatus]